MRIWNNAPQIQNSPVAQSVHFENDRQIGAASAVMYQSAVVKSELSHNAKVSIYVPNLIYAIKHQWTKVKNVS